MFRRRAHGEGTRLLKMMMQWTAGKVLNEGVTSRSSRYSTVLYSQLHTTW